MPSLSKKQHNFMEAIAHSATFSKKAGVPQSVGKDFAAADKKAKKFAEGGKVTGPLSRNLLTQTVVQPSDVDKSDLRTSLPRVYGALAGLMGTPPDQIEGSVLEPGYAERQQGAQMTFPVGTALQMLPGLKGLATAMAAEKLVPSGSLAAQRGAITWHGSPHTFDAFDSSKIGTGEGAQAYGHGLYLAESPNVAKTYAIDQRGQSAGDMAERYLKNFGNKEAALQAAEARLAKVTEEFKPEFVQPYRDAVEMLRTGNIEKGGLYKVDLPDEHIARMLDWDKPLSEQHPDVQAALSQTPMQPNQTGQDVYNWISKVAGAQNNNQSAAGTRFLREQGIPGIRYLDGGSRGTGQGTSNFVVFPGNENLLTILERNGQPLTPPAIPDTAPSDAPQQYAQVLPFRPNNAPELSLPQTIKNLELEIKNHGDSYVNGGMNFEDFSTKNTDLIGAKIEAERQLAKWQAGKPANSISEVYPGYNEIPVGTRILASHGLTYPDPTMGTVIGRRGLRTGSDAQILPVVDFGDGKGRPILPGDIHQIFDRNAMKSVQIPDTAVPAPPDIPQQYTQGGSVQQTPEAARLHHIVFVKPLDQIGPEDHDFIRSLIQKGQN